MSNIMHVITIVLSFLFWLLVIGKLIAGRCAPEREVEAEVFDKYKTDTVSRFHGAFKQELYIVIFKAPNKKYSFAVSEFSYNNYKRKQKGILKYKGNKIISFQAFGSNVDF